MKARSSHRYRAMRDFVQSVDDTLPGKFEVTKEGIVRDLVQPNGPHEFTVAVLRKRLESVMPEEIVAHTGTPDVEDEPEEVMRRPDVMVIAEAEMERDGSFDPRSIVAAVEIVSRSNPDNDWVSKARATRPARTSSTARTSPSPTGRSPRTICRSTRTRTPRRPRGKAMFLGRGRLPLVRRVPPHPVPHVGDHRDHDNEQDRVLGQGPERVHGGMAEGDRRRGVGDRDGEEHQGAPRQRESSPLRVPLSCHLCPLVRPWRLPVSADNPVP